MLPAYPGTQDSETCSDILPGQFQEDSLGPSYWAGQKSIFWSSTKAKQSIPINKSSTAVVFTSKKHYMKKTQHDQGDVSSSTAH